MLRDIAMAEQPGVVPGHLREWFRGHGFHPTVLGPAAADRWFAVAAQELRTGARWHSAGSAGDRHTRLRPSVVTASGKQIVHARKSLAAAEDRDGALCSSPVDISRILRDSRKHNLASSAQVGPSAPAFLDQYFQGRDPRAVPCRLEWGTVIGSVLAPAGSAAVVCVRACV